MPPTHDNGNASPKPTDAELAILTILWSYGPCTVRQVHEHLEHDRTHGRRSTGYTTVLKLMQIMADKRLVERNESQRTHVYHASRTASEQHTQRRLVRDLLERAFGGSAHKLVMHALAEARATPHELGEIRKLLDEMKREDVKRET
jgi:BlaI family penicillinase repressor